MPQDNKKQASLDKMVKEAAAKKYGLGTIVADTEKVSDAAEKISTLSADVERMKPIVEKVSLIQDSIKGEDGKDGNDGADGNDGKDGVDGRDGADGIDGINGTDGKDGVDGIDGVNGVDGTNGKDAEPLKVIEAIKLLKGKDAQAFSQVVGSKIDISHVRNAGSFIFNGKTYKTEELMHGGGSSSGGGITSISVASSNGFAGTSSGGTTPIITLSTSITGLLKGNGTAISAATANTDYQSPITLTTTGSSGAATFDGTTLNIPQYSGGGGTPGGLNTQLQYNNAGSFGGITGAVTDGTAVSLTAPHLLNPTINGAGTGLATLAYPNTSSSATITLPTVTGTLATLAGTETLTNKTLTAPTITGATITTSTVNGVTLTTGGGTTTFLNANGAYSTPAGTGTVTTVSVATANGFSGTVANATTTPAITIIAGAITPTSVNSVVLSGSSTPTLAVTGTTTVSGANTGDQTITLTSDVTGSGTGSFATTIKSSVALAGSPTTTTQTPSDNSTKIATTAYVDNAVLGQNFKEATLVATTANLVGVYVSGVFTYTATGTDTIDGVTLALGNRVLVKNQTTTFQNGWYIVTTAGAIGVAGVLTRSTDANTSGQFKTGDSSFVSSGTVNTATTWAYTGVDSPTLGTTAITYVQVAGLGSYVAGNGITLTGNSFSIDTSITVDKTTSQTLTNKTLTSPTLTTPSLGVATATSINGNTFTTGTYTLTGTAGKTLNFTNSLTLSGTDSTTMTFPTTSATIARTDAAQTFTGVQTFSSSPVLSTGIVTVGGNAETFPSTAQTLVGRTSTDTLTNKRITRRTASTSGPGATPTTVSDNVDLQIFTALAANITSMSTNLSGTANTGDFLEFWFTDNGTARTLSWGANFAATTIALPTTTVISTKLRILFEWGGSTWDCVAVA